MSNPTPNPGPEPVWCLMYHRDSEKIEEWPEDAIEKARAMGWHLLAKDSDVMVFKRHPIEPAQRNENRAGDTGED